MLQRGLQLEAAAAHETRPREDSHRLEVGYGFARLMRLATVDQDFTGHDERLRFFPGVGQAAVHAAGGRAAGERS